MQQRANVLPERIMLRIDPAKKRAFLEMLKLFDFVEVEPLGDQVKRYIANAPQHVPLTDQEIMQEIKAVRKRTRRV